MPEDKDNLLNTSETPEKDNSLDERFEKERYNQIVEGSKAEVLLQKNARKVYSDHSNLLDLDKEMGKKVVKLLFDEGLADSDDYNSIVKGLNKETPKSEDKTLDDDLLREKFKRWKQSEDSADTVTKLLAGYDDEERQEILKKYNFVAEGKHLTPEQAQEQIEDIIWVRNKPRIEQERKNEGLLSLADNSISTKKGESDKGPSKKTVNLANTFGLTEADKKRLGLIS